MSLRFDGIDSGWWCDGGVVFVWNKAAGTGPMNPTFVPLEDVTAVELQDKVGMRPIATLLVDSTRRFRLGFDPLSVIGPRRGAGLRDAVDQLTVQLNQPPQELCPPPPAGDPAATAVIQTTWPATADVLRDAASVRAAKR